MRHVDYIVVHTAGAYDWRNKRVVHQRMEVIRDYHIRHNGWDDIGYHAYIEEDGGILRGRHDEQVGSHVGGFNQRSLGICVSGHGDFAPFNAAQMSTLVLQCAAWCRAHHAPAAHVLGHRETDEHGGPPVTRTCPGILVDMDEIRARVLAQLEAA